MQPDLDRPEVKALTQQASTLLLNVEAFSVVTSDQYLEAGELLKRVKAHQRDIAAVKDGIVKPLNAGLKAVRDLFRVPESKIDRAEETLKHAMGAYRDEQDRLREHAQRAADEEARREQQRLEQQATRAAAKGQHDKALELSDRAAMIVAPVVVTDTPHVAGVSARDLWSAQVLDLRTLVQAVAAGTAPMACIEANQKFLNSQARSLKGELSYPGVRAVRATSMASGAAS